MRCLLFLAVPVCCVLLSVCPPDDDGNSAVNGDAVGDGSLYGGFVVGATAGVDWDSLDKTNPRSQVGTAEDIAGLAAFLCSRAGACVVGKNIALDGGSVNTRQHHGLPTLGKRENMV